MNRWTLVSLMLIFLLFLGVGITLSLSKTASSKNAEIASNCPLGQYVSGENSSGLVSCVKVINFYFLNSTAPSCSISTTNTVMAGAPETFIPRITGNVSVTINFEITVPASVTTNLFTKYQFKYGTGSAPLCRAINSGTRVGQNYTLEFTNPLATDVFTFPESETIQLTGLTLNTGYWFELGVKDSTLDTWQYAVRQISVIET